VLREWPRFDGSEDLAAIEAVPLAERDLPESTYALLSEAGARWPDKPAMTLLPSAARWEEPEVWTFSDLLARVHRIANALTGLGVSRHDAVGILSPNTGDVFAATLAAEAAGIAAPINSGLSVRQIEELLRTSGAKVLVAAGPELDPAVWETARGLARTLGLAAVAAVRPDGVSEAPPELEGLDGVVVAYLDELAAAAPADHLVAEPPVAADIAGYFHTGGSTGTPKIAIHTHANEIAMAWIMAVSRSGEAAILGALPLFHVNALMVTGLSPLFRGQPVLWVGPLGYRDPGLYPAFWRIVERYRVGAMSAVPTVYAVLGNIPIDADISSLTQPIVGAAPLPETVRRQFHAHTGVELCEGYGLTEGTCASARTAVGAARAGSVGQRMPYQQVKAVFIDPETGVWTDLPTGEPGVLAISGPTVFPGYLRRTSGGPVADPSGKIVDGWLDTGDLASVDADGYIYRAGRAKDLIIRGGHNIDPAGIEESLLEHPAVSAAAAVGRPDRHSGEVPVVYVALQAGAAVTAEELTAWAGERAPERSAAPKDVYILDEIPLTAVGKQYKPALRQDALRRVVELEIAERDLPGVTAAVTLERDQPVVVIEKAGHDTLDELAAALDGYSFPWRFA
jgi:fatty-acyl-CoA synthase